VTCPYFHTVGWVAKLRETFAFSLSVDDVHAVCLSFACYHRKHGMDQYVEHIELEDLKYSVARSVNVNEKYFRCKVTPFMRSSNQSRYCSTASESPVQSRPTNYLQYFKFGPIHL
jgi:hypothetical protein